MDCRDCRDEGKPNGCRECGRSREMTAEEREFAAFDRQDAARSACQVHAHSSATCSNGTHGCPLHHGR